MFSQFVFLFCINVLSAIGYSLLTPMFPFMAKDKGVDEYIVGIIFSCFPVANIIAILLSPKVIHIVGRRKLLYIALLIESLSTLMFGLLPKVNNKMTFITLSAITRLFQGIGSAFSSTLVYSFAGKLSNDSNLKTILGYMELGYSLGLTIGPLVASFLFYINGYAFPFQVCGILLMICVCLISNLEISEEFKECDVNFMEILFDYDILATASAIVVCMIASTFIFPVFTLHLNTVFGLGIEVSSVFLIIMMLTYFLAIYLFLDKITDYFGLKCTIFLGGAVNIIAVLFLSPISFLPQNLIVIVFGLATLGITGSCVTVPGIVDFMNTTKDKMGIEGVTANDVSSGILSLLSLIFIHLALFMLTISMGEAAGPIIGGYFTNFYGINTSCYFVSFLCLVSTVSLFIYNYQHIIIHCVKLEKDSFSDPPRIHSLKCDLISLK